ncbi:MAG: precorrin-8X methylmutase [Candidatus Avoscillospira sp.]
MSVELQRVAPADIEARSMEIIQQELGGRVLPEENKAVILRAIHTTADFDYADNLVFSPGAVAKGVAAFQAGADIVTDTTMAMSGINKRVLGKFGGQVHNFIADPAVAAAAKERGVTRATVSMERAAEMGKHLVYAIGNAPTALVRLYELWQEGKLPEPALIIGVPVGFVNVVEAKELILQMDCPYIVARGRKGGSNVAAAICNALLYTASQNERE